MFDYRFIHHCIPVPYHFVPHHRRYSKDPVLLQREGCEPQRACLPALQRQGHTTSPMHLVAGWRPRHQRQSPPPGPLRDPWGPCGQPAQCDPHAGAGRRGVPVHMQQLSGGRVPPGSNKRKRCLSNQLLQEQQYTYLSVCLCVCLCVSVQLAVWHLQYTSCGCCWGLKVGHIMFLFFCFFRILFLLYMLFGWFAFYCFIFLFFFYILLSNF